MKRTILLSCLIAFTSITAFAQLPNFTLGIKGGVNVSKLNSNFLQEENRLGYQVGAWARLGGMGLYLQPEAYLGSKGSDFKFTQSGNEVATEGEVKFTTLDVPLLLGTKIGPSNFNIRFMAGPVISFIVNDKSTFQNVTAQFEDFDNYKNQTWAAQAGAGIDFGNLSIDARYEAGLSNISKNDQFDQKQNLWHISLGYKLF
ncbi:MAG TPA: porin family protein [Sphingobacteriaceae bacterium]